MKILYVEDNDDLRATITVLLQTDQREVSTCADAEEALAMVARERFDVVVTDVSLPGMSGVDLARRLVGEDPQRWVVLCSGYQFGEHVGSIGPRVRSIAKPFEIEDLERLIDEIERNVRERASAAHHDTRH